MNLNKGCIEILSLQPCLAPCQKMNLNKGCIEIKQVSVTIGFENMMNLNKGCIEIVGFNGILRKSTR